jgi:hypothetical protein
MDRTKRPPFPEAARTGRVFISPCRTVSLREFLVDGTSWLASSIAGHGWSASQRGHIGDTIPGCCMCCGGNTPELVGCSCQGIDRRSREQRS